MSPSEIKLRLRHILGKTVTVEAIRSHSHPGTGIIDIITTPDNMFVLKNYTQERVESRGNAARLAEIETHNMALLSKVISFAKPRYYGAYGNSYLQDFIPGKSLAQCTHNAPIAQVERYYGRAVETLAAVHTATKEVTDRRRLRRSFSSGRLEQTLKAAVARIVAVGIPAYAEKGQAVPKDWSLMLNNFPFERVIADLAVGDRYVLGHGDFQASNLIVGDDGQLWVIDWLGMAKAQPWYDLAYLLAGVPLEQKWPYVDKYVGCMQERGRLKGQTKKSIEGLFRSGMIYQELIRARSNALFVRERANIHHVHEFRNALTSLNTLVRT